MSIKREFEPALYIYYCLLNPKLTFAANQGVNRWLNVCASNVKITKLTKLKNKTRGTNKIKIIIPLDI